GAGTNREPGRHDAVAPEDVEVERGDVHRPAETAAVAGLAPHQLGHHPIDARALGDAMAVAAMVAHDAVLLAQRRARARGHRFLADERVRGTLDEAGLEQLRRLLVEAADSHHRLEEVLEELRRRLHGVTSAAGPWTPMLSCAA